MYHKRHGNLVRKLWKVMHFGNDIYIYIYIYYLSPILENVIDLSVLFLKAMTASYVHSMVNLQSSHVQILLIVILSIKNFAILIIMCQDFVRNVKWSEYHVNFKIFFVSVERKNVKTFVKVCVKMVFDLFPTAYNVYTFYYYV